MSLKKYSDYLKEIRNGEYSLEYIISKFETLILEIEQIVEDGSAVPHSPDENKIKELLIACLEVKYGNLEEFGFRKNIYHKGETCGNSNYDMRG